MIRLQPLQYPPCEVTHIVFAADTCQWTHILIQDTISINVEELQSRLDRGSVWWVLPSRETLVDDVVDLQDCNLHLQGLQLAILVVVHLVKHLV